MKMVLLIVAVIVTVLCYSLLNNCLNIIKGVKKEDKDDE